MSPKPQARQIYTPNPENQILNPKTQQYAVVQSGPVLPEKWETASQKLCSRRYPSFALRSAVTDIQAFRETGREPEDS